MRCSLCSKRSAKHRVNIEVYSRSLIRSVSERVAYQRNSQPLCASYLMHVRTTTIADSIRDCLGKPRNSSPSRSNLSKLYVIICLIPGISRESSPPDNATEHSMLVEQHYPALERIVSPGQEAEVR